MNWSEGARPQRSIPVETDESVDIALVLHPGMTDRGQEPGAHWGLQQGPGATHPTPLDLGILRHPYVRPTREQRYEHQPGASVWCRNNSIEPESLEAPNSLKSVQNFHQPAPLGCPPGHVQCHCCPPGIPSHHHHQPCPHIPQNRRNVDGPKVAHAPVPQEGVMREVSVGPSAPVDPGEIRRTINLPEECKIVFITYSVDTAKEMIPFSKFLIANGFQPAIDIFDSPIRSMDTTKWMDRFLNDKSVLIIVVISPQYKEDVEGVGGEEHGLHTKYIHNQIQNEFIQQGCLNYRLVPVLFPSATKSHVPGWLRSTRLYHWPQDGPDLLLRLFRMDRYIVPPPGPGLTLTVRTL